MATDKVTTVDKIGDDVRQGIADGGAFYRNNLDAIMASNHAMIRGFQTISAEALAFMQSRMKETLETGRRLAACRKPEDAFEAHVDFMRTSLQAYVDEFKRMSDVGGQVLDESIEPLRTRATEVEETIKRAA